MSCCEDCDLEYGPPEGADLPDDWHELSAVQRHYYRNKDYYIEKANKHKNKRREFVRQIKTDRGCQICGFDEHYSALEFHHMGEKEEGIANMLRLGASLDEIEEEIKKCRVLCANCHRIEHSDS